MPIPNTTLLVTYKSILSIITSLPWFIGSGADVMNKFEHSFATLSWNKALSFDVKSHVTTSNQLKFSTYYIGLMFSVLVW